MWHTLSMETTQIIASIFILFIYALPAIIAKWNKHPSVIAIEVLSLLFGWTIICWIIALAWSVNPPKSK